MPLTVDVLATHVFGGHAEVEGHAVKEPTSRGVFEDTHRYRRVGLYRWCGGTVSVLMSVCGGVSSLAPTLGSVGGAVVLEWDSWVPSVLAGAVPVGSVVSGEVVSESSAQAAEKIATAATNAKHRHEQSRMRTDLSKVHRPGGVVPYNPQG